MCLFGILTKLRIVHPYLKQIQRSYKHIVNMNTVYFRHENAEQKIQINFRYTNKRLGIDRAFNFVRNEDEKIGICLDRIRTNLQKEFTKKTRKVKSKKIGSTELNSNDKQEQPTVSVKMVRNGDLITEPNLIELSWMNDLELHILDEPFTVAYNLPWISLVALPSSILATCYVYPSKLELQHANPNETTFIWYKGKKASNKDGIVSWKEIGNESMYLAQSTDVDHVLKVVCTPRHGIKVGPSVECISECLVDAGPGVCLFESRHLYTKIRLPNDQFRVVTYNILADLYADSDYSRSTLFPYCPPYALAIDYRKQLFIKEILGYNGDIICLQEVDSKVFDLDLKPFLQLSNYVGTFKAKGQTAEGLATFFHSSKFSLVKSYGLNIGENIGTLDVFDDLWKKIQNNENLVKRITERSTAVQVTTIKAIDSNKIIIIANTHLYFHPDADHVRLLQIGFCLKYVEHVYNQTKAECNLDGDDISIIFCGDFNSVPECGIFKLMTQQYVEENFIDFRSNKSEAVKDISLSQPFQFKSAYETNPKYTNFTVLFAACLDYIFYQSTNLSVIQSIPLPTEAELKKFSAIPSVVYPSDHVALIADLKWKK